LRMSKRRARRRASRGVCEAWTVRYHPHFRWDICILFVLGTARVNATVVSLQVLPVVLVHWTLFLVHWTCSKCSDAAHTCN